MPEAVHVTPDGYRALDYAALSAFLVEVARAQQAEIEGLKAKLAELEGTLAGRSPR